MQKIKGNGYTLDKKQEYIYSFNKNTVYRYRLSDFKLMQTYKSLSNIIRLSLSYDEKQLAVTNTSGTIAVHSVETGEMIGKSRMERKETFFTHYMKDDDGILCADWNGKIMCLDTSNFKHRVLMDLKYPEGEFKPLLLDADKMQIIEVVEDGVSTKINVCDVPDFQFREQDYVGIVDCLTERMMFGQDYYMNLNCVAGCSDVTFFNQKGILHKVSLPVKYTCSNYNLSKSQRYLIFCDSVILGSDSVKILDIYNNKIVKTYHVKYVDDMYISALQFIHNDREILIPTWEGIYVEPLNLP